MANYLVVAIFLAASIIASASSDTFVDSNRKFSVKFYAELLKDPKLQGKSLIFSPYSIQSAGALLYAGADGETASEMVEGFNLPSSEASVVGDVFQSFTDNYVSDSLFKMANKVFVAKDCTIAPSFYEIATKKFHSDAESVDFGNSGEITSTINHWIENKTGGKIKNFLEDDSLGADTRMLLANAIYFKGGWKTKFDPKRTSDGKFFLGDGDKTATVKYMSGSLSLFSKFDFDRKLQIAEIPFKENNVSLAIIMPLEFGVTTGETLDFLNNLNLADILVKDNIFSGLTLGEGVNLMMPKFKAELKLSLKTILDKLGMKHLTKGANFDNLLDPKEPLQLSDMKHGAVIDVNEEGAEAVAATTSQIVGRMATTIILNRPFLYFIKGGHGEIYFMGRFTGK